MDDEDNNVSGEKDSIFGEIVIYSVLIFILLTFLLWVINRLESEKERPVPIGSIEKKSEATVASDFLKSTLNPKSEVSEDKSDDTMLPPVSMIPDQHIRDLDNLIEKFENIESNLSDYLKNHTAETSDPDKTRIHEELEKLREALDSHPELISGKLDRLITLIEKKNDSKLLQPPVSPVKAKIPHPETGKKTAAEKPADPKPEKAEGPADTAEGKTLHSQKTAEPVPVQKKMDIVPEPVPKKTEASEKIAAEEEKNPAFAIPDNILTSQELKALRDMEEGAVSAKTLCKNRQNTVHFLSSQLLVRLIDIYPPDEPNSTGRAVIDVTHPRLGLRRFSEMEEGTTRPFEYGTGVFFLELIRLYPNCADVAVYERKNS